MSQRTAYRTIGTLVTFALLCAAGCTVEESSGDKDNGGESGGGSDAGGTKASGGTKPNAGAPSVGGKTSTGGAGTAGNVNAGSAGKASGGNTTGSGGSAGNAGQSAGASAGKAGSSAGGAATTAGAGGVAGSTSVNAGAGNGGSAGSAGAAGAAGASCIDTSVTPNPVPSCSTISTACGTTGNRGYDACLSALTKYDVAVVAQIEKCIAGLTVGLCDASSQNEIDACTTAALANVCSTTASGLACAGAFLSCSTMDVTACARLVAATANFNVATFSTCMTTSSIGNCDRRVEGCL